MVMSEVQFLTPLFCPKKESSTIFYQTFLLVLKKSARKAPSRIVFPEYDTLGWSRGVRSSAGESISIDTHVSQEKGVSDCPAEPDGPDTLEAAGRFLSQFLVSEKNDISCDFFKK